MPEQTTLSDEELVEKIRKNDKELYAKLVERYQSRLLRYAFYLIHDKQKAADIVQESFIKAYINLQGFNIHKSFSSWIYRIVHNETMNYITKNKKFVSLPKDFDYQSDENIEESLIRSELQKETQECLMNMPHLYREPLALYYIDEKSYAEISDILRIPMGTVATRINRAKVLMKKLCLKKI